MAASDEPRISGAPRHAALADALFSNTVDLTVNSLTVTAQGFLFKTDGALKVTTSGGETITFPTGYFAAGVQHTLQITRIFVTGTTMADMAIFW